jgi:hypothetical protein
VFPWRALHTRRDSLAPAVHRLRRHRERELRVLHPTLLHRARVVNDVVLPVNGSLVVAVRHPACCAFAASSR